MEFPCNWQCTMCWESFSAVSARDNHTFLTGHDSWFEREDHAISTGHQPDAIECGTHLCDPRRKAPPFELMNGMNQFALNGRSGASTLPTEDQLASHQHVHHNYCAECDRTFMNSNNLKEHLHSRRHLGQSIKCPFCERSWVTAAGMTHHLEFGSCPEASKVNHDTLYNDVRSKDPGGVFTKDPIDYQASPYYEANEQSYNPYRGGYECYLCHSLFSSLQGLTQHLNSPTHQQPLYHCPNRVTCGKEFKSLASIINHLERESCGFVRFEKVQHGFQDLLSTGRQIKF